MLKYFFLWFFLIFTSNPTFALFTWDDEEKGTGLHVSFEGEDREKKKWAIREAKQEDVPFYHDLLGNINVVRTMASGKVQPPDQVARRVEKWVNWFEDGLPFSRMTLEQESLPIGFAQIAHITSHRTPGYGEVIRALNPPFQGKGLGKTVLGFIVETWAPRVKQIGEGKDPILSGAMIAKFKCFEGQPLRVIYATARPSNRASWECYKYFDFHPSEPTNTSDQIQCETWEESRDGPLEDYLIHKHFQPTSSIPLQTSTRYSMIDESGHPRTLSYIESYGSLRYHFEHTVK